MRKTLLRIASVCAVLGIAAVVAAPVAACPPPCVYVRNEDPYLYAEVCPWP